MPTSQHHQHAQIETACNSNACQEQVNSLIQPGPVNVFTPLVSLRVGGIPANVVNTGTGHIMYGRHISADGRNAVRQTVREK